MNKWFIAIMAILLAEMIVAQSSPVHDESHTSEQAVSSSEAILTDTIDFDPYPSGTLITDQYLEEGLLFSGHEGSGPPMIYDYGEPQNYGRTLTGDAWFQPLKLSFVDPGNILEYQLARRIEFDNVIEYNGEVDHIIIEVFDENDNLIETYSSHSPERVILDFSVPTVAYITVDDSAATAYVLDNFYIDFEAPNGIRENAQDLASVYPNPSNGRVFIESSLPIDEIAVFSASGQLIFQDTPRNNLTVLRLTEVGVYIARVTSGKSTEFYKLLVIE